MKLTSIILILLLSLESCSQKAMPIEMAYQEGKLDNVILRCQDKLRKDPDNLTANHLIGRAYLDLKMFDTAIPYLEKSNSVNSPKWMKAWALSYLGIAYFNNSHLDKSIKYLEKAISLSAIRNVTKFATKKLNLIRLIEYSANWTKLETKNIRFHFQPNHEIGDLRNYSEQRQHAYEENNEFFKAQLPKKIDYFIWSNEEEGKNILGRQIGFANSELCMINSRINQTKGHELTHIICDYGIKPLFKNRLINEGIAVAFDFTQRDRIAIAQQANSQNLTIEEIYKQSQKLQESIVYPIGGALIEYLYSLGDDKKFKKLARDQSWENLIDLYGQNLIEKFETRIKQ